MTDPNSIVEHVSNPDAEKDEQADRESRVREAVAKLRYREFAGLTSQDARALADEYGLRLRLIGPDDFFTEEYAWGRVSAWVPNNIVTKSTPG